MLWLQDTPDANAKLLFDRLRSKYPQLGFKPGQLRTLQRRVRQWRQVMAKKLVFGASAEGEDECIVVGDAESGTKQPSNY